MAQTPPNMLLVTTDQQRHDTCGPDAPGFMRTPHFDQLCREGVRFSRTYADCPVCVPSRVSIMTGQYVFTHRMSTNGSSSEAIDRGKSLPSCLKALGYQTAAIGKMHFTPQRARHGFDEMLLPDDYYIQMRRSGLSWQPMRHGLGQNELYPGMATVPEALTLTSWIAERCVDYIRDRRDPSVPFFIWCSFPKPHPPLDPPEPYYSMYRGCDIPEPVFGDWSEDRHAPAALLRARQSWSNDIIPPEVIREARAAYYGLITQNDYNLGRVLAALQDRELLKETLIIFTSDHGEYLGDHRMGGKSFFHEPSAHVPMVLRLPKSWSDRGHGTVVESPVTLADILPTLVSAAGGKAPESVDGINLIDVARGAAEPRRYLEGTVGAFDQPRYLAITDGHWKYIWYPEGSAEQLFDLEEDPRELKNLAGLSGFEEKLKELKDEMTRRHRERSSPMLQDDRLPVRPLLEDSTLDRRNAGWPGYHTDQYHVDVRH